MMLLSEETKDAEVSNKNDLQSEIFQFNGHLSEDLTALYVDKLMANKLSEIPNNISAHLDSCLQCKTNMLKLKFYYEE